MIARDGGVSGVADYAPAPVPGIVSKLAYSTAVILLLGNKRAMP